MPHLRMVCWGSSSSTRVVIVVILPISVVLIFISSQNSLPFLPLQPSTACAACPSPILNTPTSSPNALAFAVLRTPPSHARVCICGLALFKTGWRLLFCQQVSTFHEYWVDLGDGRRRGRRARAHERSGSQHIPRRTHWPHPGSSFPPLRGGEVRQNPCPFRSQS